MADNLKVAVRVRPLLEEEKLNGLASKWICKEKTITTDSTIPAGSQHTHTFDSVYGENSTSDEIYKNLASDIVKQAMRGFNGTLFTYGQSGSGKTFTIDSIRELALQTIYECIENCPEREFLMRVSYFELYNEKLIDLLNDEEKELKVREDVDRNVYIDNLKEEVISCQEEVHRVLAQGNERRKFAETRQNKMSSRAHCIFRIVIESRERADPENSGIYVSHLNLVDLAGSERAGLNTGDRFREGTMINKSLLYLSQVIQKLSDEGSNTHINYRNSKLTRILQNALGGNSRTAILCTISPTCFDETVSTLRFAENAKKVTNKPTQNEVLTDQAMLKKQQKQIDQLEQRIKSMKEHGGSHEDIEELQKEMTKQAKLIQHLESLLWKSSKSEPVDQRRERQKRRETVCVPQMSRFTDWKVSSFAMPQRLPRTPLALRAVQPAAPIIHEQESPARIIATPKSEFQTSVRHKLDSPCTREGCSCHDASFTSFEKEFVHDKIFDVFREEVARLRSENRDLKIKVRMATRGNFVTRRGSNKEQLDMSLGPEFRVTFQDSFIENSATQQSFSEDIMNESVSQAPSFILHQTIMEGDEDAESCGTATPVRDDTQLTSPERAATSQGDETSQAISTPSRFGGYVDMDTAEVGVSRGSQGEQELHALAGQLAAERVAVEVLKEELEEQMVRLEETSQAHDQRVVEFEEKVAQFEERVAQWEREKLLDEEKVLMLELKKEAAADVCNRSVQRYPDTMNISVQACQDACDTSVQVGNISVNEAMCDTLVQVCNTSVQACSEMLDQLSREMLNRSVQVTFESSESENETLKEEDPVVSREKRELDNKRAELDAQEARIEEKIDRLMDLEVELESKKEDFETQRFDMEAEFKKMETDLENKRRQFEEDQEQLSQDRDILEAHLSKRNSSKMSRGLDEVENILREVDTNTSVHLKSRESKENSFALASMKQDVSFVEAIHDTENRFSDYTPKQKNTDEVDVSLSLKTKELKDLEEKLKQMKEEFLKYENMREAEEEKMQNLQQAAVSLKSVDIDKAGTNKESISNELSANLDSSRNFLEEQKVKSEENQRMIEDSGISEDVAEKSINRESSESFEKLRQAMEHERQLLEKEREDLRQETQKVDEKLKELETLVMKYEQKEPMGQDDEEISLNGEEMLEGSRNLDSLKAELKEESECTASNLHKEASEAVESEKKKLETEKEKLRSERQEFELMGADLDACKTDLPEETGITSSSLYKEALEALESDKRDLEMEKERLRSEWEEFEKLRHDFEVKNEFVVGRYRTEGDGDEMIAEKMEMTETAAETSMIRDNIEKSGNDGKGDNGKGYDCVQALQAEIDALKAENETLKKCLYETESGNLQKQEITFEVDSEKQSLENEKQSFEGEKQSLEDEKQNLESEKQTLENERQSMLNTLEQERGTLQLEKDNIEAERERLTQMLSELESKSSLEMPEMEQGKAEEAQAHDDLEIERQMLHGEREKLKTEREHFEKMLQAYCTMVAEGLENTASFGSGSKGAIKKELQETESEGDVKMDEEGEVEGEKEAEEEIKKVELLEEYATEIGSEEVRKLSETFKTLQAQTQALAEEREQLNRDREEVEIMKKEFKEKTKALDFTHSSENVCDDWQGFLDEKAALEKEVEKLTAEKGLLEMEKLKAENDWLENENKEENALKKELETLRAEKELLENEKTPTEFENEESEKLAQSFKEVCEKLRELENEKELVLAEKASVVEERDDLLRLVEEYKSQKEHAESLNQHVESPQTHEFEARSLADELGSLQGQKLDMSLQRELTETKDEEEGSKRKMADIEAKLKEYEQKIANYEEEKELLCLEKQGLEERMEVLSSERDRFQEEIYRLSSENMCKTKELDDSDLETENERLLLVEERQALEEKMKELERENEKVEEEKERLKAEREELEESLKEFKSLSESTEMERESLTEDIKRLGEERERLRLEREELERSLENSKSLSESAQMERDQIKLERESVMEESIRLREEREELERSLGEFKEERESLRLQGEKMEAEREVLAAEAERLSSERELLEQRLREHEMDVERWKEEKGIMGESQEKWIEEKRRLEMEIEKLRDECFSRQEEKSQIEKEKEILSTELQGLQDKQADLTDAKAKIEEREQELLQESQQLREDKENFEKEKAKMAEDRKQFDTDMKALKNQQEFLDIAKAKLEDDQERVTAELTYVMEREKGVEEKEEEMRALEENLKLQSERLALDQEKIATEFTQNEERAKLLKEEEERLEKEKAFIEESKAELQFLADKEEELKAEMSQLASDQEDLQTKYEQLYDEKQKLDNERKALDSERQALRSEREMLETEREDCLKMKQQLQEDQEFLDEEKLELQDEKEKWAKTLEELEDREKALASEHNLIQEKKKKYKAAMDLLQEEEERLNSQRAELEGLEEWCQQERLKLKVAQDDLEMERLQLEKQDKEMEAFSRQLKKEAQQMKEEQARISAREAECQKAMEKVEDEAERLRERAQQLKERETKLYVEKTMQETKGKGRDDTADIKSLRQTLDRKGAELAALQADLKDLRSQKMLDYQKIQELKKKNERLEKNMAAGEEIIQSLKMRCRQTSDAGSSFLESRAVEPSRLGGRSQEQIKMREEMNKAGGMEAENECLRIKLKDLETQLAEEKETKQDLEEKLKLLQTQKSTTPDQETAQTKSMAKEKAKISKGDHSQLSSELKAKLERLEREKEILEKEKSKFIVQLEMAETVKEGLTSQVHTLLATKKNLDSQLKAAKIGKPISSDPADLLLKEKDKELNEIKEKMMQKDSRLRAQAEMMKLRVEELFDKEKKCLDLSKENEQLKKIISSVDTSISSADRSLASDPSFSLADRSANGKKLEQEASMSEDVSRSSLAHEQEKLSIQYQLQKSGGVTEDFVIAVKERKIRHLTRTVAKLEEKLKAYEKSSEAVPTSDVKPALKQEYHHSGLSMEPGKENKLPYRNS